MNAVTAVVVGLGRADPGVATVVTVPSFAELRDGAEAAQDDLLWILDSTATPSAQTLPALLEAARVPAASLPVDAVGEPVEAAVGRYVEHDVPALLAATEARRVPLRRAAIVSLLIRRATVLAEAAPDPARFGAYAGMEWSARVFAREPAVLVPASRVEVAAGARGTPLQLLRAARAGGWGTGETLRELQRSVAG